jgi:YaiO family outer membrane protein
MTTGTIFWLVCVPLLWPDQLYALERESCSVQLDSQLQDKGSESAAPYSADTRFSHARELAQAGCYEFALAEYAILIAEQPQNVDYVFGQAQALFWSGEADRSLKSLAMARAMAPDYEEVWRFELQVLSSRIGKSARIDAEKFRAMATRRFSGVAWLSTPLPPVVSRYRWEFGTDREFLSNDSPDWNTSYAYFDRRATNGNFFHLTAITYDRFDLSDTEFGFGPTVGLSHIWTVAAAVKFSSTSKFLPESTFDIGVSRKLNDGWVIGLRGRSRRYPDTTVNTFGADVDKYFGKFRAAYYLDNTYLSSEATLAHRAVLSFYADSGSQVGVTIAAGEEAEIVAPGQLLKTTISAIALSGRHPINDYISVVWRLGTHRQGSLYRRDNIGVSIAGGF